MSHNVEEVVQLTQTFMAISSQEPMFVKQELVTYHRLRFAIMELWHP